MSLEPRDLELTFRVQAGSRLTLVIPAVSSELGFLICAEAPSYQRANDRLSYSTSKRTSFPRKTSPLCTSHCSGDVAPR